MCVGGIAGVLFLANAATKTTKHAICIPSTVSTGQSLTVVVRYLCNHPEKLNDAFAFFSTGRITRGVGLVSAEDLCSLLSSIVMVMMFAARLAKTIRYDTSWRRPRR
jgi:hypothetical protein